MEKNDYKKKVIDLLKINIKRENGININANLEIKNVGSNNDLLELYQDGKIKKIYIVCDYKSFNSEPLFYMNMMYQYEEKTRAEVFLVYLMKDKLQSLTLKEFKSIRIALQKALNKTEKEIVISNFEEFYAEMKKTCKWENNYMNFFFRGQKNDLYPEPSPTIYRNGIVRYEDVMYKEAIRRNPALFTEGMTAFDNLVKMQHYELPTRLLDITTNPLVALYFACQEDNGANGLVFIYSMLQAQIKYFDSNIACIISNLAKIPFDYHYENDVNFLVNKIKEEKAYYNKELLLPNAVHEVICVLPKLNNDRIENQSGAFLLYGMGEKKDEPATPTILPRIIKVKADAKPKILKELDLMGINESRLFPEPVNVMKQIKQEFSSLCI